MEYIYATLLLHKAGQEVNEANLKKVVEAAGIKADDGKIKAVIASLEGVDIEDAIANSAAVAAPAAAPAAAGGEEKPAETKEEKKEEKKEEESAAGLGALFG